MKTKKITGNQESKAIDNMSKLPELCYTVAIGEASLGIIKRGESGFYRSDYLIGNQDPGTFAAEMNAKLGVTQGDVSAMVAGSMFGWHCPGADPDMYNEDGSRAKP